MGYSYADLSNPGTKFEGVRVHSVDEKNKCRYQFEVDRGEITRGKKAFFSIGLIPVVELNSVKMRLYELQNKKITKNQISELKKVFGKANTDVKIKNLLIFIDNENVPALKAKNVLIGEGKPRCESIDLDPNYKQAITLFNTK